jgi:hypothetical protein
MEHFHALHGAGIDEDKRMINAKSPWTLAHLEKSVLQGFYNNPEVPPSMKTKLKEAIMMKPQLKGGAIADDAELMTMSDEDIDQMALDDDEALWMIARRNHLRNPARFPDPGAPPYRGPPPPDIARGGGMLEDMCLWLDSCVAPRRNRPAPNPALQQHWDMRQLIASNAARARRIMEGRLPPRSSPNQSPNNSPRVAPENVAPEVPPSPSAVGAPKSNNGTGKFKGGLKGVSKASGFIRRLMWENKDKHKGTYKKPTWGLAANSKMNKPAEFKIKKLLTPAQGGENEEGNSYGASPFIRHHFMGDAKPFVPGKADGKYGHESRGQKKARKDFKKKVVEKPTTPPKEAPKEKPPQLAEHFGNVREPRNEIVRTQMALPPLSSWYGQPEPAKAFTQAQKKTQEQKEEGLKKQYIAMWEMYNGQIRQAQQEIDFAKELFSPQGEDRRKGLSSQGLLNEKKKGQLAENNMKEAYKTRERIGKVLKDKGWVPDRLRDLIGR